MFDASGRWKIIAGVALALMVLARVSAAQNVYSYNIYLDNQVTTNTCSAGEPVALTGNLNFQYSFQTDSSGNHTFSITVANSLNGLGQSSGASYRAADSNTYTSTSADSSSELIVDFKSLLASQTGATVNMNLIQTLDITVDTSGNVSAQVTANNTDCS
jgi:hypothetical protein